jgi:VanZ family protein
MRPIAWPAARVVLMTLGLALLTEGLQFFAVDRHPRLTDVGIDMTGALLGLVWGRRLKMNQA